MPRRWAVVAWSLAIVIAMVAAIVIAMPGEDGLRSAIRATARTSLILFLAAFVASAVNTLTRGGAIGKWLLANRRHLGLGFAGSHLVHGALIVALAATSATYAPSADLVGLIGGLVGFGFLAAMTVTSFDGPTRALGRRRWKLLHTTGMYVYWAIFASSFAGRATRAPEYGAFTALTLAALVVRIVARRRA